MINFGKGKCQIKKKIKGNVTLFFFKIVLTSAVICKESLLHEKKL